MSAVSITWGMTSILLLALPGQVELPSGFELVEIGQSDIQIGFSRMNNCGQIVFSEDFLGEGKHDIVLYDNGVSTRITDTRSALTGSRVQFCERSDAGRA